MRKRGKGNGISLHAVAGTHVVLLGIDLPDKSRRKKLLGFAIHREDQTEHEQYWLSGYKTFQAVNPNPVPGALVDTRDGPVQNLLWSDYTAKPDHTYTYTVVPMTGEPKNLIQGKGARVTVSTESEDHGTHAVFFNRAVIGSEAYARKFGNVPPGQVPGRAAYKWLSRGLEEAIVRFIGRARNSHYALRAAVYEFDWPPVLEAFAAAAKRKADVKIVYDHRQKEPGATTDHAVKEAGIGALMKKRRTNKSYLSHNKFIVLLKDGKPIEVWTGSTNFTESGIFGQSNVGHLVRDPQVAAAYLDYWERLNQDPKAPALRQANVAATPDPTGAPKANSITPLFSPRTSLAALEWYGARLAAAGGSACFTAAFGVNPVLAQALEQPKPYLRFVLLERRDKHQKALEADPNVRFSIGTTLTIEAAQQVEHYLREFKNPLGTWVLYVHTKYMLLDPLSKAPTVISGSANFSDASTHDNDENMLVIQGDTRVADVYLGEFMRLFDHFRFRDVLNRLAAKPGSDRHQRAFLTPDDTWLKPYYTKGTYKFLRRELFA